MTEAASTWRVASYSGSSGNCVEVGQGDGTVLVRDTKNREAEALHLSPATWRRFAAATKTGLPR